MSKPYISIVIPVYNAKKYVSECIESVLAQTAQHFEIILVDDGSTDGSSEICDQYQQRDSRIITIHQSNAGVASARNTGLGNSKGEYLVFLDADDTWHPKFLEKMLNAKKSCDLPICKIIKCHYDGTNSEDPSYNCNTNEWCWPILYNYSISCFRCLFDRRKIKEQNLRFTTGRRTGEDQEFTYKYMLLCDSICYTPDAEYYYRINSSSAMFQKNYSHFDAVEAMKAVEEYAKVVLPSMKMKSIQNALMNYKYPYLLEFAVITLLGAGEKTKNVVRFLKNKNYDNLLDEALHAKQHWDSCFIRLWGISPSLCLKYYSIHGTVGNLIRIIGLK